MHTVPSILSHLFYHLTLRRENYHIFELFTYPTRYSVAGFKVYMIFSSREVLEDPFLVAVAFLRFPLAFLQSELFETRWNYSHMFFFSLEHFHVTTSFVPILIKSLCIIFGVERSRSTLRKRKSIAEGVRLFLPLPWLWEPKGIPRKDGHCMLMTRSIESKK